MSFSPSSSSRTGAPSAFSSDDIAAGIQYCRINSPITVPGPTRVSSAPSAAVVISGLLHACVVTVEKIHLPASPVRARADRVIELQMWIVARPVSRPARQLTAIGIARRGKAHPGRLHRLGDAFIDAIEGQYLLSGKRATECVEDVRDLFTMVRPIQPARAP